jgi:hypothetical protein
VEAAIGPSAVEEKPEDILNQDKSPEAMDRNFEEAG